MQNKQCECISKILLVIGGLNWGLVGIGVGDIIAKIFGADSIIAKIIYILVGLAAIYTLATGCKDCSCRTSTPAAAPKQ